MTKSTTLGTTLGGGYAPKNRFYQGNSPFTIRQHWTCSHKRCGGSCCWWRHSVCWWRSPHPSVPGEEPSQTHAVCCTLLVSLEYQIVYLISSLGHAILLSRSQTRGCTHIHHRRVDLQWTTDMECCYSHLLPTEGCSIVGREAVAGQRTTCFLVVEVVCVCVCARARACDV